MGVHPSRGLILNTHTHTQQIHICITEPFHWQRFTGTINGFIAKSEPTTHQQHQRRAADHGDGCGQFASVASAVGPSAAACVLGQTQLVDGPLCHLQDKRNHI